MAVVGLLIVLLPACGRTGDAPPPSLAGEWTSDHPDYRGRSIEFDGETVIFRVSEIDLSVHPIRSLEARRDGDGAGWRYDMTYSDGGEALEATLLLAPDGALTFRNQPHVKWWRVEGGAGSSSDAGSSSGGGSSPQASSGPEDGAGPERSTAP